MVYNIVCCKTATGIYNVICEKCNSIVSWIALRVLSVRLNNGHIN
jgi:hypothetical protein